MLLRFPSCGRRSGPRLLRSLYSGNPEIDQPFLSLSQEAAPLKEARNDYAPAMFVDFRPATSWNEVDQLVEGLGSCLNERHLSAAFYQLKRVKAIPSEQFLRKLSRLAIDICPGNYNCKSATLVLQACSYLAYFNKDLFERVVEMTLRETHKASFRDIARMIHAVGSLQRSWQLKLEGQHPPVPKAAVGDVFPSLRPLVEKLTMRLTFSYCHKQFDPVSLAILFQGLGQLNYCERIMMNELAQLVTHPINLNRLASREVATILMALCRLKHKNTALVKSLTDRALSEGLLPTFNEQEMCNVLFSLGHLGFSNTEDWALLSKEAIRPERLTKYTRVGLSNILHGLATVSYKDESTVDALAREASKESRLTVLSIPDLTTLVHSLGRLEYPHWDVWSKIGEEVTKESRLLDFDERGLASIVYGFGKAGFSHEAFVNPLVSEIVNDYRLPHFSNQAVANMIYGLGKIGFKRQACLEKLCQEMLQPHRLEEYTEQGVSSIFYGIALLNIKNVEILRRLLAQIISSKRLASLRQQSMTNILFCIHRLNFSDESLVNVFLTEFKSHNRLWRIPDGLLVVAIKWLGSIKNKDDSVVQVLVDELVDANRIRRMSVKELSLAVYALGKIEWKQNRHLDPLLQEIMLSSRWSRMDKDDIGQLSVGLGMVGRKDTEIWSRILEELSEDDNLVTFRSVSISSVLMGLAKIDAGDALNIVPSIDRICLEIKKPKRLEGWRTKELSNVGWALARLRYYDAEVMSSICAKFLEIFEQHGRHKELETLVCSCAALNHNYTKLEKVVLERATSRKADSQGDLVDSQFVSNAIWSQSVLDMLSPGAFSNLLDELGFLKLGGETLTPEQLLQISRGFWYVRSYWKFRPNTTSQSMLLSEAQSVHRNATDGVAVPSLLHSQVGEILTRMGVAFKENHVLEDGCTKSDFVLDLDRGQVLLEVHEGQDYSCNKPNGHHRLLGPSEWKNRILKKSGYQVVDLPEWSWEGLTELGRKEYLEWLLTRESSVQAN